jgi:hypothetical protein
LAVLAKLEALKEAGVVAIFDPTFYFFTTCMSWTNHFFSLSQSLHFSIFKMDTYCKKTMVVKTLWKLQDATAVNND